MKLKVILLFFLMIKQVLSFELGVEGGLYLAGQTIDIESFFDLSENSQLGFSVGFNNTDRGDLGENQSETGEGFGFGFEYRKSFTQSLLWNVRIDFYDLEIRSRQGNITSLTEIKVIQPTVGVAHQTELSEHWRFRIGVQGGVEINTDQKGPDVGEGAIGLLRVSLGYLF